MNIGIDIDGVVANTPEFMKDILASMGFPVKDDTKWCFSEQTGVSPEIVNAVLSDPQFYANLPPMPRSGVAVRFLQELGHEIFFVTARPYTPELVNITANWLEDHIANGTNLIFNPDKVEMAKAYKMEWFVEDNLDNAVALSNVCSKSFLVTWPYNSYNKAAYVTGYKAYNLVRVESIASIVCDAIIRK